MRPIDKAFWCIVAVIGIPPLCSLLTAGGDTTAGTVICIAAIVCCLACEARDSNRSVRKLLERE